MHSGALSKKSLIKVSIWIRFQIIIMAFFEESHLSSSERNQIKKTFLIDSSIYGEGFFCKWNLF